MNQHHQEKSHLSTSENNSHSSYCPLILTIQTHTIKDKNKQEHEALN